MFSKFMGFVMAVCVGIGFVGCGEKTPQELRAEFRELIQANFVLAPPLLGGYKNITQDMLKCGIDTMTDMFSDDEIRLYLVSSMSEAMNNAGQIVAIQTKMKSEQVMNAALLQCMNETTKQ